MRALVLTVLDPNNDDDSLPPVDAEIWLDAAARGQVPFDADAREGFGVRIGEGQNEYRIEAFGSPEVMARGFRAAAERLAVGRPAALRSNYADMPIYLVFLPEGSHVRLVRDDGPPCGGFPFPERATLEAENAYNEVLAWLDSDLSGLLHSTGSVGMDRATGRLLRLDRETLVADLRHAAELAELAAQALSTWTWKVVSTEPDPPPQLAIVPRIRLLHIRSDYPKIDLLRAIRATADLSLDAAKAVVAKVLAGQPVTLDCPTKEHRRALIAAGATVE